MCWLLCLTVAHNMHCTDVLPYMQLAREQVAERLTTKYKGSHPPAPASDVLFITRRGNRAFEGGSEDAAVGVLRSRGLSVRVTHSRGGLYKQWCVIGGQPWRFLLFIWNESVLMWRIDVED